MSYSNAIADFATNTTSTEPRPFAKLCDGLVIATDDRQKLADNIKHIRSGFPQFEKMDIESVF